MLTLPKIKKVLLVEDDTHLQKRLCAILEEKGCHVTSALDALTAIEHLENNRFDVILLDIILSKNTEALQGIGLLKRMNALQINTPVILLTNKADNDTISEAVRAGGENVRSFLTKNIVLSENILYLIEQAINSPFKTRSLSELLSKDKKINIIRGVSADLHFRLQEYIGYFQTYMREFKGKSIEVSLLSYLDDIFVELNSFEDAGLVQAHFEEYLSYPLQYPDIDPLIETTGRLSAIASSNIELKARTKNLVHEISRNVDIQSVPRTCISVSVSSENINVFEYDTWKIRSNKFTADQARPSIVRQFEVLRNKCEYLIAQNNTSGALSEIGAFCKAHQLNVVSTKQLLLTAQFEAARNAQILGIIDQKDCDRKINDLNVSILNLMIDIEKIVLPEEGLN